MSNSPLRRTIGGSSSGGGINVSDLSKLLDEMAKQEKAEKARKKAIKEYEDRGFWSKAADVTVGLGSMLGDVAIDTFHAGLEAVDQVTPAFYDHEHDYATDDIVKAIATSYKDKYGGLTTGWAREAVDRLDGKNDYEYAKDLKSDWKAIKADPFGTVLDVAGLALSGLTLGASAGVAGGINAARVGMAGSTAVRTAEKARLLRVAAEKAAEAKQLSKAEGAAAASKVKALRAESKSIYDNIDDLASEAAAGKLVGRGNLKASSLDPASKAGRWQAVARGGGSAKASEAAKAKLATPLAVAQAQADAGAIATGTAMGPITGRLSGLGSGGRSAVVGSELFVPATTSLNYSADGLKSTLLARPAPFTPQGKAARAVADGISNALPETGLIGSAARAAKYNKRVSRIQDAGLGAGMFAGFMAPHSVGKTLKQEALGKDKDAAAARYIRGVFGFSGRTVDLEEAKKSVEATKDFYTKNLKDIRAMRSKPGLLKENADRVATANAISRVAREMRAKMGKNPTVAQIRSGFDDLLDADGNPVPVELNQRVYVDVLRDLEDLPEDAFARKYERLENLVQAAKDKSDAPIVALESRLSRLQNEDIIKRVANPGLSKRESRRLMNVENAEAIASKGTTSVYKRAGTQVRGDRPEMMLRRILGDDVFDELTDVNSRNFVVRPHTRDPEFGRSPQSGTVRTKNTNPGAAKTKSANNRYNRGYTFDTAMDQMGAEPVLRVFNEAKAYAQKMSLLDRIAPSIAKVTDVEQMDELVKSGRWVRVDGEKSPLMEIATLQSKINNEYRAIVGNAYADVVSNQLGDIKNAIQAQIDKAGLAVMPKAYADLLEKEIKGSRHFLVKMIDAPTNVFRMATLNLRPAWMVNNVIGQNTLLAMSMGPYHMMRELLDTAPKPTKAGRAVKAERKQIIKESAANAMRVGGGNLRAEMQLPSAAPEFWEKMVQRSARSNTMAAKIVRTIDMSGKAAKSIPEAMGKINAAMSDDLPRRALFMKQVRPLMNRVAKTNPDLSANDALRLILADDKNMAMLVDKTMGDLIDFSRLSGFEREVLRRFIPFYSWMKGMTVRAGDFMISSPGKTSVAMTGALNQADVQRERFGNRPVPQSLLGSIVTKPYTEIEIGGRKINPRIISTAGMNIFQTPLDIVNMGRSLTGKGSPQGNQNPLSTFNPVLKSLFEVTTGKDMFTGADLVATEGNQGIFDLLDTGVNDAYWTPDVDERRSAGRAWASRYLASLAPVAASARMQRAYEADGGETDYRLLMRSPSDVVLAYMGLPIATLNSQRAEDIALDKRRKATVSYDPTLGERPGVFGREYE